LASVGWLAVALVFLPAFAAAQEPAPSPSPVPAEAAPAAPAPAPPSLAPAAPSPAPAEAPGEKAKPADATEEGDVRIRADTFGGEKGLYHYRGFVDLNTGDVRIQADTLDYKQTTKPDGKVEQHIVAEGNVVFMRGEERLAGRRMEMDLDKATGFFEDARGYGWTVGESSFSWRTLIANKNVELKVALDRNKLRRERRSGLKVQRVNE